MPDIAMCANHEGCPQAKTCYRATAKPSEHQCYAAFYVAGQEYCDYYDRDWSQLDQGSVRE